MPLQCLELPPLNVGFSESQKARPAVLRRPSCPCGWVAVTRLRLLNPNAIKLVQTSLVLVSRSHLSPEEPITVECTDTEKELKDSVPCQAPEEWQRQVLNNLGRLTMESQLFTWVVQQLHAGLQGLL